MSAVGMLAPFFESLFVAIFRGLQNRQQDTTLLPLSNERKQALQDEYWNPRIVFRKGVRREDLALGIQQITDEIGLSEFLPQDYKKTLIALFTYRNKMFHLGLEWPKDERKKFSDMISQQNYPCEWFDSSTSGGDPWIFI